MVTSRQYLYPEEVEKVTVGSVIYGQNFLNTKGVRVLMQVNPEHALSIAQEKVPHAVMIGVQNVSLHEIDVEGGKGDWRNFWWCETAVIAWQIQDNFYGYYHSQDGNFYQIALTIRSRRPA